jgi:hypothetical protein
MGSSILLNLLLLYIYIYIYIYIYVWNFHCSRLSKIQPYISLTKKLIVEARLIFFKN